MKYRKTKNINKESEITFLFRPILVGVSSGAIICSIFLFLFAFLFVISKSIPQFFMQWITIFCADIGAFFSGYISVKMYKSKGLIYGAMSGFLLFIILTIISFIVTRDAFTLITLVRFLTMTIFGSFGGILSVNKRK